jgi:fatty acid desaturase
MLSLRSRALGWNFAMVAAFIGVTIGVAVKATWWWPFLVILAVAGFGQLLGWSTYTTAEEGTADDADAEHQVRSPASS